MITNIPYSRLPVKCVTFSTLTDAVLLWRLFAEITYIAIGLMPKASPAGNAHLRQPRKPRDGGLLHFKTRLPFSREVCL